MEWIRVSDRKPIVEARNHWAQYKEALEVIVCNDEKMVRPCACTFDPFDKCFIDYNGDEVKPTHWMLLPKMPGPNVRFQCRITGRACSGCQPGPCDSRKRV